LVLSAPEKDPIRVGYSSNNNVKRVRTGKARNFGSNSAGPRVDCTIRKSNKALITEKEP